LNAPPKLNDPGFSMLPDYDLFFVGSELKGFNFSSSDNGLDFSKLDISAGSDTNGIIGAGLF